MAPDTANSRSAKAGTFEALGRDVSLNHKSARRSCMSAWVRQSRGAEANVPLLLLRVA